MGERMPRKRTLVWLLLIASLCVVAVSGFRLWQIHRMYAQGDRAYEELACAVKRSEASQAPGTESPETKQTGIGIPPIGIDFEALREINPDAAAWLYSPDTVIDYPVMRAGDYDRYLRHLPDGTYNENGCLFLDYNNPPDFSGGLNIIYGHNMNSGKMFGSLGNYKEQAYFEEHPYLYLYTPQENYRVELLYGCVIGAGQWRDRAFMYEANRESLLDYAAHHTTFSSSVSFSQEDRLLILSTCSYDFDDARFIVMGVLRPGM